MEGHRTTSMVSASTQTGTCRLAHLRTPHPATVSRRRQGGLSAQPDPLTGAQVWFFAVLVYVRMAWLLQLILRDSEECSEASRASSYQWTPHIKDQPYETQS